jgi:hypothetical protein
MSKPSRRLKKPLEVTVMFEAHRLQDDLLQAAYAHLIAQPRRRLSSEKHSTETSLVQPSERVERKFG